MTTPRVTVPVEARERLAQYIKGTSPYRAWRGEAPEGEPTLKGDIAVLLSAAPAPEGGAVDGPEDDELPGDFLARVGMDGALWADGFRKMALKLGYSDMDEGWLISWFCNAVMAGYDHAQRRFDPALATREEAPAEAGEANLGWFSGLARKHGYHAQADWLDALRAQPPAREDGGDRPIEASWTDGVTHAYVNLSAALSAERQAWRQKLGIRIASVRYLDVEGPPAREDAQPVGWKHTDKCWGKTSYSDEMAHCYCQKEQEKEASPQPVGWLRPDTLKGLMDADESVVGIQSLVAAHETKHNTVAVYTHPAPDALRVAVEALGEVSSLTDKDVSAKGLRGVVELLVEIQTVARQALAALQAEQKGGA